MSICIYLTQLVTSITYVRHESYSVFTYNGLDLVLERKTEPIIPDYFSFDLYVHKL